MKIHPLLHGVSFHPSVSSFFFLCSFKKAKIMKECVDELAPLSHKTVGCTRDIISYAPVLTDAMSSACTLLHRELIIRANLLYKAEKPSVWLSVWLSVCQHFLGGLILSHGCMDRRQTCSK